MDNNVLIELIKGGMTMANSTVSAVVGALVTTLFLRKNTQAEEFERIKAGKFSAVIDDLLISGKMTYLEYHKCNNFLKIAKLADEKLNSEGYSDNDSSDKDYNFDWFIRFYDYASNISDEEMQNLWASVLEGEIKAPKTMTISLLHSLSIMQQDEAKFFCNIARFALLDFKNYEPHLLLFVASNRNTYKNSGITPALLKNLERLGLVECDFNFEYVFERKKMFRTGNKAITIYGDPNNERKIKAGNVTFTRDGKLLYSILNNDIKRYRSDILDFTITKFQQRNCRVVINDREVK